MVSGGSDGAVSAQPEASEARLSSRRQRPPRDPPHSALGGEEPVLSRKRVVRKRDTRKSVSLEVIHDLATGGSAEGALRGSIGGTRASETGAGLLCQVRSARFRQIEVDEGMRPRAGTRHSVPWWVRAHPRVPGCVRRGNTREAGSLDTPIRSRHGGACRHMSGLARSLPV